jgi:hypothetical protein
MIDLQVIGMSFILMYKVLRPFLSLIGLPDGMKKFRLVITIGLRVFIIAKYRGCGIWMLATLGNAVLVSLGPLQLG